MPKKGYKQTEVHKTRLGKIRKKIGLKPPSRKGKKMPESFCIWKSEYNKKMGIKPPVNWKGGISQDIKHIRELKKYHEARRRAQKRGALGIHTYKEWCQLKREYNYMCPFCRKKEPVIQLTEDHIIPLSRGGDDSIDNIQPLCRSCNARKYNKSYWLNSKGQFCFLMGRNAE